MKRRNANATVFTFGKQTCTGNEQVPVNRWGAPEDLSPRPSEGFTPEELLVIKRQFCEID